jgi:hypothetical protein
LTGKSMSGLICTLPDSNAPARWLRQFALFYPEGYVFFFLHTSQNIHSGLNLASSGQSASRSQVRQNCSQEDDCWNTKPTRGKRMACRPSLRPRAHFSPSRHGSSLSSCPRQHVQTAKEPLAASNSTSASSMPTSRSSLLAS